MARNPSSSTAPAQPVPGLVDSLKEWLVSGELSDAQFTVGRHFGPAKLYHVHKFVLCLRSPVFRAMFHGSLPENTAAVIDIPDVSPVAFGNMLSFMYTDMVESLHVDNVCQTWSCADKYDLPLLMEKCSCFVSTHLKVDNCLTLLENGVHSHAEKLVERCLEFVDQSADVIVPSKAFAAIEQGTLILLLQRDTLSTTEHAVYLAVERWARKACNSRNMDPSATNRRQMLGEALFLVRFPQLTNTQLADGPVKSGLLLHSELHDLYQYKFATGKPALPFSTKPRRIYCHRVGDVTFRHKEPVFVGEADRVHWVPAEIIGVRQNEFLYMSRSCVHSADGETAVSWNIVRAADILHPGQDVVAKLFEDGLCKVKYDRAHEHIRHIVNYRGRQYAVAFHRLLFTNRQITEFMANTEI
ncbi:BTB/POZ domain-containing protein 6-B-like [Paramacrobiotus metropolitanus]|uniref:BTB/POZ domain-containing protein 6-B-like n=1 Tax=Paramacrobiotus metropolitanus TaxID=2943436 RepID=UPI0024464DB6|nr:BTB/POZ domain-containing protein 6-B-like [Paramacrobiotus metropolitanus]